MYCIVYTVPYTILYKDAISGIDKYTVYLTEHSTVKLPLKCEYNMMYSKIYTVSLATTYDIFVEYSVRYSVHCTIHFIVQYTVLCKQYCTLNA